MTCRLMNYFNSKSKLEIRIAKDESNINYQIKAD